MPIKPTILTLLLFTLLSLTGYCQDSDTPDISGTKAMVVYGDGFKYSVKAPEGWKADTAVSNDFYANLIFMEIEQDLVLDNTVIQVYTFKKENSSLKEDLNLDIANNREEYKKLEEEDFTISHSDFKCFSKHMFVKDIFYQYTVYVDPGKKFASGVSVSMNTNKRKATDKELKALRKIVASITMLKG